MELSKKDFVCRVAYLLKEDHKIPAQTSLCRLFWRFVLHLFIVAPVFFTILGLMWAGGTLFAYRLACFDGDPNGSAFVPYRRWPKVGPYRIWPVWLLLVVLVWFFTKVTLIACGIVAAFVGVVLLGAVIEKKIEDRKKMPPGERKKEPSILREYIKAKKQKVCPIILIKD